MVLDKIKIISKIMGVIFFKNGRFVPETYFTYKDVKQVLERYTDDYFRKCLYCKLHVVKAFFSDCYMNDCGNICKVENLKCCHCIFSRKSPVKMKDISKYLFEASKQVKRKKHA